MLRVLGRFPSAQGRWMLFIKILFVKIIICPIIIWIVCLHAMTSICFFFQFFNIVESNLSCEICIEEELIFVLIFHKRSSHKNENKEINYFTTILKSLFGTNICLIISFPSVHFIISASCRTTFATSSCKAPLPNVKVPRSFPLTWTAIVTSSS